MTNPLLAATPLVARLTPLSRGTTDLAAVAADRKALAAPPRPGVYAFVDGLGNCIYIGKSRCLRARLSTYLRADNHADKALRIRQAAATIFWEELPDEFAALLREIELIHHWEPRLNVQFHPLRKRRGWVGLRLHDGIPQLFLTRHRPRQGEALGVAGPFLSSRRLRAALNTLNDELLRRVRPSALVRAFDRLDTQTARLSLSVEEQFRQVHDARRLLRGRDRGLERAMRLAMAESAAAERYELAACQRDQWQLLVWFRRRVIAVQRARRSWNFVYSVTSSGRIFWYVIRGGLVRALVEFRGGSDERRHVAAVLEESFGTVDKRQKDVRISDHLATIMAWFRRHPDESATVLSPQSALALCRDDGLVSLPTDELMSRVTEHLLQPNNQARIASIRLRCNPNERTPHAHKRPHTQSQRLDDGAARHLHNSDTPLGSRS